MSGDSDQHNEVIPLNAATLVIVRDQREVLMGVRHRNHVFMPNKYVFPGGRVDDVDAAAFRPIHLDPDVGASLEVQSAPGVAESLAMAAVRETFEETGLLLGAEHPVNPEHRANVGVSWSSFFGRGMVPALDRLEFIARAVTPPGGPRRFDTRFFLTSAHHMTGTLEGNGELLDLQWFSIEESLELDLPRITRYVLEMLQPRLSSDNARAELTTRPPIPFIRWVHERVVVDDIQETDGS